MTVQAKQTDGPTKSRGFWRIQIALVITLAAVGAGMGQQDKGRGEAARRLALEVLWNQAEVNRDAHAMSQLLTDSIVYVDIDGSVRNKAEFLKLIGSGGETMDSLKNESIVAHEYPGTVVVNGVYLEKGKVKGKPYSRRGRFTDTWVKVNGAWLCAASHSTIIEK